MPLTAEFRVGTHISLCQIFYGPEISHEQRVFGYFRALKGSGSIFSTIDDIGPDGVVGITIGNETNGPAIISRPG